MSITTQTNRDQIRRLYSDVFVDVRNNTGSTIPSYKVLKIVGDYPAGQIPAIDVVSSTSDIPVAFLIGSLPNNANTSFPSSQARAMSRGRIQVTGFDTSTANILDPVYFNNIGDLSLFPDGPQIGIVLDLNTNGIIYIDLYLYTNTLFNWSKYLLNYSDFSISSTTNTIPLFNLQPKETIEQIRVKHHSQFLGGSITDYRISIGLVGDENRYVSYFDVFQPVSDSAKIRSIINYDESENLSSQVSVTAYSFGGNLSDAISGTVEIDVLKGSLP
jgi:hypothetical protein